MKLPLLFAAAIVLAGGSAQLRCAATPSKTQVDVVVDMTADGHKLTHPTPEQPAYYFPVVVGYRQLGDVTAGEKVPDAQEVEHIVAVELAKQGYRVTNPGPYANAQDEVTYADGTVVTVPERPSHRHPLQLNAPGNIPLTLAMLRSPSSPYSARASQAASPTGLPSPLAQVMRTVDPVHGAVMGGLPSIILSMHWGSMNPSIEDFGNAGDATQQVFFNQNQMLGLVAGNTLDKMNLDFQKEEVMQNAEQDRYFVLVTAFDYNAYVKQHKRVMLWQAHMSIPSDGLAKFADVEDALIKGGAPFFGRETTKPLILTLPVTPAGQVEIGTPTVKDYFTAPTPAPAAPSAAK